MTNHEQKAKRIDRVRNTLTEERLVELLPEVDTIYDETLREGVIRAFLYGVPDEFFEKPSSSTGKYHSPDERGKYGNLMHTKRVFAEYCNLSESYLEAHGLTEYERECGKAAALLHDTMKYGWPSEQRDHTTSEHDLIAAAMARHIGGLPQQVYDLIAAHMGPWAEGPLPKNDKEWLLHFADKSASGTVEDDLAMYYPSDEILEEWPETREIEQFEEPI